MIFSHRKLVHWLAALAILMSALAPAVTQAVSLAKHDQGFTMVICSANGDNLQIQIQGEEQGHQVQSEPCPYCLTHGTITPAFEQALQLQAPPSFALLPALFYQSLKRYHVWLTPPSTAPPVQA
jgi:hypothetical protein